jgi:dTDP-4-dehydrorhamnose 3,5-epimerase
MATVPAGVDGLDQVRKDRPTVGADGTSLEETELIAGLEVRHARTHADGRGTLSEVYDLRWGFTDDPLVYVYVVTLRPGQIRGWALHLEQNDRLFVYGGTLRIVIYDARTDSETYGRLNVFHFGQHDRALVSIPAGTYHAV